MCIQWAVKRGQGCEGWWNRTRERERLFNLLFFWKEFEIVLILLSSDFDSNHHAEAKLNWIHNNKLPGHCKLIEYKFKFEDGRDIKRE